MGFQFVHEECYARTAAKAKAGGHSVRTILAEAQREPAACPHVENPQQPRILFGVSLDQVEQRAHEYAENMKDARGRKLRADSPVLLAGVVSCPPELSDEAWKRLHEESVAALRERYGDRLLSVVEHTDEDKRHVHYYCVPLDGERFDTLHTGRGAKAKAEAEAKAAGSTKKEIGEIGNSAYRAERRRFQDWFFERVGVRHGLTRLGPRRRRLSRPAWKAEQAQAAAAAHAAAVATDASRRAAELAEEAKRRAREAMESEQAARRAQAAAAEVVAASARQAELAAAAVAEQRRAERRAERVRRVAAGRQEQAELAKKMARPIEKRAAEVQQGQATLAKEREALTRERRALAESRQRWERAGARVGAVVAALREVISGPVRRLRERIESMQREHAEAVQAAKVAGRQEGRAESQLEIKGLTDRLQKTSGDAESLRKQRDEAEDKLAARREMAAQLRDTKKF